jgi:hypothetical protein
VIVNKSSSGSCFSSHEDRRGDDKSLIKPGNENKLNQRLGSESQGQSSPTESLIEDYRCSIQVFQANVESQSERPLFKRHPSEAKAREPRGQIAQQVER